MVGETFLQSVSGRRDDAAHMQVEPHYLSINLAGLTSSHRYPYIGSLIVASNVIGKFLHILLVAAELDAQISKFLYILLVALELDAQFTGVMESFVADCRHLGERAEFYRSEDMTVIEGLLSNPFEGGRQLHRLERIAKFEYAIRKVDDSFRYGHSLKS